MKRQDAFALADFDKDRILSRKFFSGLNLPTDKTDKEILLSFDISDVDGAEKAVVVFAEMRQMTKLYLERIKRHALKLENLNKKIAVKIVENGDDDSLKKKFNRSKLLSKTYNDITFDIGDLFHRLQDRIDACDAVTSNYCRKSFAKNLKQARKSAKLTQKQTSQLIGVSISTYIGYENSKREPSLSIIRRIMKVLDIRANMLIN